MSDRTTSAETVRALARSAPGRWASLHLLHRSDHEDVEAWLRHGELRARVLPDGPVRVERGAPSTSWPVRDLEPFHSGYWWSAMLDPYELSEHVAISGVHEDVLHGRPVLRFVAHAEPGYEPVCSCCPLIFSEITQRYEHGDSWQPLEGEEMPDGCALALDLEVGIVVSSRDRRRGGAWFENEILAVGRPSRPS